MFCFLGDEKINAGLIARAGPGSGERKDERERGMRPCRFRVGKTGIKRFLGEEEERMGLKSR